MTVAEIRAAIWCAAFEALSLNAFPVSFVVSADVAAMIPEEIAAGRIMLSQPALVESVQVDPALTDGTVAAVTVRGLFCRPVLFAA